MIHVFRTVSKVKGLKQHILSQANIYRKDTESREANTHTLTHRDIYIYLNINNKKELIIACGCRTFTRGPREIVHWSKTLQVDLLDH